MDTIIDIEIVEPKVNKYKGRYKEKAREEYLANREAVIEKNKELYQKNKERRLQKQKEDYSKNKDVKKLAYKLAKQLITEIKNKN